MRLRTPADFGALIRDRRRKHKLRQQDLARKVGVSRQWLVELEAGKAGAPLALVLRTLNALGVRLAADDTGKPSPQRFPGKHKPVDIDRLLDNLRKKRP